MVLIKLKPSSSIYMVDRRIIEDNKLWGLRLKYRGETFKVPLNDIIEFIETNPDQSLLQVDILKGVSDLPVLLTVVESKTGKKSLRTVWDNTTMNNLAKVPEIKLVSANKLKILRPKAKAKKEKEKRQK